MSAVYVPKAAEQVELRLLIKDQAQVIQAMQAEMAEMKASHAAEIADVKATSAEEMAKMKATIKANLKAHNEERRLGVKQDLDDVIATVQTLEGLLEGTGGIQALQAGLTAAQACCATNAATIESVITTVQENADGIEAVNSTVQANVAAIEDNSGSIEEVNATVQDNVADIEAVNSTLQDAVVAIEDNADSIEAVNSTVQALGTQLEDAVAALNASIAVANDCCVVNTAAIANNTAALTRVDSDGDGVSDLDDGCPNDEGLTLFGAGGLSDTSQCDRTPSVTPSISAEPSVTPSISAEPSVTPSISAEPSLTPSLTPSISAGPSVSLAPTTCQQSITTDSSGSKFLVSFVCNNSLLLYLII